MGAATDLSGRNIKFQFAPAAFTEVVDVPSVEFEIVSGSVSDVMDEQFFLPVGRNVKNVIAHGHQVMFNFQGVLLVKHLPWRCEFSPSISGRKVKLAPGTEICRLQVVLNRGGTGGAFDEEPEYDEVEHYAAAAIVVKMEHTFDTSTHQIFDVTIAADGYYIVPSGSASY